MIVFVVGYLGLNCKVREDIFNLTVQTVRKKGWKNLSVVPNINLISMTIIIKTFTIFFLNFIFII